MKKMITLAVISRKIMATELLETLIHNNDELNRILQYIINNPLNWKYEENHT